MPIITPVGANGAPLPVIEWGTAYNVSYNAAGGASTQSVAIGATGMIQISARIPAANSGVRVAIGTNPTATATSTWLPASGTWFAAVYPGWKVAVLSDDSGTGSINITEAADWG